MCLSAGHKPCEISPLFPLPIWPSNFRPMESVQNVLRSFFSLLLMHSKHFTFIPHKLSDSHLITAEYNDLYEVKSWRTFMVLTWNDHQLGVT